MSRVRPMITPALLMIAGAVGVCAPAAGQTSAGPLSACPARQPILRIATVSGDEIYSAHPAETRFSSTHYARLTNAPLFGVNPLETGSDPTYGVAESWQYQPGATAIRVKIRKGLTFNDDTPITAEDVAFSIEMTASKFADTQISGTLNAIGAKAKVIDADTVEIGFTRGSPTFDLEMSPLVFPIYVTSKAYHSNGEVSQAAFDKFRSAPMGAGPYRVVNRQAQQFITLEAARKDPLLGCPLYDRIEIRHVPETATRMNQLRTGQQDIISGSRDLVDQARRAGASVGSRADANVIGFYFFHTDNPANVFHKEELRKAAAHAIDHKLLGETIWGGVGYRQWGCTWPPATEVSTKNPRYVKACGTPYAYDPARAKQLLQAAGYAPGKGPRVTLEFSVSYPEEAAMAEAMQAMLKEVGFDAVVERTEMSERNRRRQNGLHTNSLLFFGPGGRVTALAGAYSVLGPDQGWGPRHDKDMVAALSRAATAGTLDEYTEGMADVAEIAHGRAYAPGFFSTGALFFLRRGIADWGLEKSVGRGPLNLAALVTKR